MRNVRALLFAATLLLACSSSKSDPPPPPAGCDLGDGSCITGGGLTQAICTYDWAGTYLGGGCPASADRIGICSSVPDLIVTGADASIVFYTPGYTAGDALDACLYEGGDYSPACPSGGGTTTTISCLFAGDMCDYVYASLNSCQFDHLSLSCSLSGGAFAEDTCPLAGQVGGYCRYGEAAIAEITGVPVPGGTMFELYYSVSWTTPGAQSWCGDPPAGTWVSY